MTTQDSHHPDPHPSPSAPSAVKRPSAVRWRWVERDFGFRFQQGKGKSAADYYQATLQAEFIALHPFREGNGRSAFILSDLVLLQNGLVPLDTFIRKRDRDRYFAACQAARLKKNYTPLAGLIVEWEAEAQEKFDREQNGEDIDR